MTRLEELLDHSGWMLALARALVRDEDRARDAVQETWARALARDADEPAPSRSWLGVVVKNCARRIVREEARRRRREEKVARREPCGETSEDVIIRAELRRRVLDEILALPEPYRETVLLRFFEGKSAREIAARDGVAPAAIHTRLRRALARLRIRLDRAWGDDRASWRALLAPFAALSPGGAATMEARSIEAAATSGVSASHPVVVSAAAPLASAPTASVTALQLGGILMTKKLFFAGAAALAMLGAGLMIGREIAASSLTPGDDLALRSVRAEAVALRRQLDELGARLRGVSSERDRLSAANEELTRRLIARDAEAAEKGERANASSLDESTPSAEGSGIEWEVMSRLIAENVEILNAPYEGRPLDPAEEQALRRLQGELLRLSAEAKSRSPHPFLDPVMFGELARALFGDALALTDEQLAALDDVTSAIAQSVPPHAAELSSLEIYRLRQDVKATLLESVEPLLDEGQLARWATLREYCDDVVLEWGGEMVQGVDANTERFLQNWLSNALRESVSDVVGPLVPVGDQYLSEARRVLERYGPDDAAIEALAPRDRERLDTELLELQMRYQARIAGQLGERGEKLERMPPLILRFMHERGARITGTRDFF